MKGTPVNNTNKPFFILAAAIAGLFAISFVVRFVALSEMGVPGGWMLFMCLPAGGIGLLVVLLRLGMLNGVRQNFSAFSTFNAVPSAATKSQRLQEIENLRASGALSDDEYTAERARIISSI
jgi:hypothetical protein